MGGSNLRQAFPNYLICMHFIRISTVSEQYLLYLASQASVAVLSVLVGPPSSSLLCMLFSTLLDILGLDIHRLGLDILTIGHFGIRNQFRHVQNWQLIDIHSPISSYVIPM